MREKFGRLREKLSFLKSLRVIFFIIIFLVGAIPCTLLQNAILRDYEARAVEVRVEQVKGQMRSLANHLISSNYLVNQESGQDFAESYPDMRPEETCPGSQNKTLCDPGRGRKNEGGIIAEPDSKLP